MFDLLELAHKGRAPTLNSSLKFSQRLAHVRMVPGEGGEVSGRHPGAGSTLHSPCLLTSLGPYSTAITDAITLGVCFGRMTLCWLRFFM